MEIWLNPACSKCRTAVARMHEAGVSYTVRRYLDDPPTPAELEDVLRRLELEPWDIARPKENSAISGFLPEERAWIDGFLESGFVDSLRLFNQKPAQYTWWDMKSGARARNVGWRIDYFYVSEDLKPKIKNAWIDADVMGSDHCPIGLELAAG